MLKYLIDSSITMLGLRYFYKKYQNILKIFRNIYKNSYFYKWIDKFLRRIGIYFQDSLLLARITQEIKALDLTILENSRFGQYMVNLYIRYKIRFNYYLTTSELKSFTCKTQEEICFSPLKAISIIAIIAVITNTALSALLKNNIILWDWLLRSLLLFLGASGLCYNVDWHTLKENSLIIKLVTKK